MTGAKVDGRIVPLDFKLETGMIVEIITSKGPGNGPSRDWLKIVKTSEARTKIRSWFKKERREEKTDYLTRRSWRRSLSATSSTSRRRIMRSSSSTSPAASTSTRWTIFMRPSAMAACCLPHYAAGQGEFQKTRPLPRRRRRRALAAQLTAPKKPGKPTSGVIVEGLDSCLVKFAKCCNPLPGDPIVGFITRGYGVLIHKQDCVNVINAPKENEGRWVHAEWASNVTSEKFKSTIDITSQPRDTLLADVTILLSNMHIPMHALVAKESKDHSVILIQVTVEVNGVDQLNYLLNSLRAIKGGGSEHHPIKI